MKRVIAFFALLLFTVALHAEAVQERQYRESFWKIYTEALRGDRTAQYQTGVIFERGLGVEKNETKAAEWYEKAAYQGYADAQYNIAIMYAAGRGIEQNDAKAMMWLALAAKQGDGESRQLLLDMIDGRISTRQKHSNDEIAVSIEGEGQSGTITPVTLICKANSMVCSRFGGKGECTTYKVKTVLTSKEKQGNYYKISGIVVNHKWQDYDKEGWIDEESVDIRR